MEEYEEFDVTVHRPTSIIAAMEEDVDIRWFEDGSAGLYKGGFVVRTSLPGVVPILTPLPEEDDEEESTGFGDNGGYSDFEAFFSLN
jgi:hypothetical protein